MRIALFVLLLLTAGLYADDGKFQIEGIGRIISNVDEMTDQERGCYMALTCYCHDGKRKGSLNFDGIVVKDYSRPGVVQTWEVSHYVSIPNGITIEEAVFKMVKRYGKNGVLKIFMAPFVSPKSCLLFLATDRDKDGYVTIMIPDKSRTSSKEVRWKVPTCHLNGMTPTLIGNDNTYLWKARFDPEQPMDLVLEAKEWINTKGQVLVRCEKLGEHRDRITIAPGLNLYEIKPDPGYRFSDMKIEKMEDGTTVIDVETKEKK